MFITSEINRLPLHVFSCISIDERRIDDRKVLPCTQPKPETWKPNPFSQRDYGKLFFDKFVARTILMKPVMVSAEDGRHRLFSYFPFLKNPFIFNTTTIWSC